MRLATSLFSAAVSLCVLCVEPTRADTVTLYTSIDEPVARKVIDAFQQKTGHTVRLVTDTEASRSVGIAEKLAAEKDRPRAEVWWGNEIFYTVGLAEAGAFDPLDAKDVDAIDLQYVDPQRRFAGVGLRVRTLGVKPGTTNVTKLSDLLKPELKGQVVMARPTSGTTGGHVAALYTLLGDERADAFFKGLHDNGVTLVGGNSVAAQQVAAGNYVACITDNDDIVSTNTSGVGNIDPVLPDQADNEQGTLTIPTTVALVHRVDHSDASKQLVTFLLSADTERVLFDEHFIAASTRKDAAASLKVKAMKVDYVVVGKALPRSIQRATALMEGRVP
ncbi:MAG: extracellular solute-binding protein [Tepidisphaeraceae bacterium]